MGAFHHAFTLLDLSLFPCSLPSSVYNFGDADFAAASFCSCGRKEQVSQQTQYNNSLPCVEHRNHEPRTIFPKLFTPFRARCCLLIIRRNANLILRLRHLESLPRVIDADGLCHGG